MRMPARSMAPRAMKYAFTSSTLVAARSVSPRTLFATARPIADSAAVSQRTVSSAEPDLLCIAVVQTRIAVHGKRNGYRGHVEFRSRRFHRRHFDADTKGQAALLPVRPPKLERRNHQRFQIREAAVGQPVGQYERLRARHHGSEVRAHVA